MKFTCICMCKNKRAKPNNFTYNYNAVERKKRRAVFVLSYMFKEKCKSNFPAA